MSTKPFLLLQKTKTNNLLQARLIVGRGFLLNSVHVPKKIRSSACTCCSLYNSSSSSALQYYIDDIERNSNLIIHECRVRLLWYKNVLLYTTTTYYYYCSFFICIWRCELRTEEQFIFIPYHYKAEMYYVYHVGRRKNKYGTLLKFQLKPHCLPQKIIQRDVKLIT